MALPSTRRPLNRNVPPASAPPVHTPRPVRRDVPAQDSGYHLEFRCSPSGEVMITDRSQAMPTVLARATCDRRLPPISAYCHEFGSRTPEGVLLVEVKGQSSGAITFTLRGDAFTYRQVGPEALRLLAEVCDLVEGSRPTTADALFMLPVSSSLSPSAVAFAVRTLGALRFAPDAWAAVHAWIVTAIANLEVVADAVSRGGEVASEPGLSGVAPENIVRIRSGAPGRARWAVAARAAAAEGREMLSVQVQQVLGKEQ